MSDEPRHVKPTIFEGRIWLRIDRGVRVRRGTDWAWVIESRSSAIQELMEEMTDLPAKEVIPDDAIVVRQPGKGDTIWRKAWIDQVDDKPIKAGDRVHFVPCEAIRVHYKLPVSAIATVTHSASGSELSHLMQVRLLDGREGKFCFVQDVKSLIRREDING